jgi:twitching motility protein PilT
MGYQDGDSFQEWQFDRSLDKTRVSTGKISYGLSPTMRRLVFSSTNSYSGTKEFIKMKNKINILASSFYQHAIKLAEEQITPEIAMREQGFFLVTGSVGNGKSTTLASMVSAINKEKSKHIMTIEDPIEFFYEDELSFIDQREIGIDVTDFELALKNALREDADVLIVGEMRNIDTIRMAVTSAQTGHLVFSTLHTNNASQSIERIIDVFPAEEQKQIRVELSVSLLGVFSQKLVPSIDGQLVPAYELMMNTPAVSHLIREGRVKDLDITIENGLQDGHVSYNRSLSKLFFDGIISRETALNYSQDKDTLAQLLGN